jgi:hypothetical protein
MAISSYFGEKLWAQAGPKDYSRHVAWAVEDVSRGDAETVFRLKNKQIGNGLYNITGYRTAKLRNIYSMFIFFDLVEDDETTPDFVVKHNWFTDDDDIHDTLLLFFEANDPEFVSKAFAKLREDGHILIDAKSDLLKKILGVEINIPNTSNDKLLELVHEF